MRPLKAEGFLQLVAERKSEGFKAKGGVDLPSVALKKEEATWRGPQRSL